MPIELYPNIAKVKRNGVYQNLPGFVQASGDADIKAMIASSESSTTAQYAHSEGSYFILNDVLYKAIVDIAVNDIISVGTNCEVAILCNDVSENKNDISYLRSSIDEQSDRIDGLKSSVNAIAKEDYTSILFTLSEGYIKYNDGTVVSSPDKNHTDYIDVSAYSYVKYKREGTTSAYPVDGMVFYDSNKNYISGSGLPTLKSQSAAGYLSELQAVVVPQNAVYARFSAYADTTTYGNLEIYGKPIIVEDLSRLNDSLTDDSELFKTSSDWMQGNISVPYNGRSSLGSSTTRISSKTASAYEGEKIEFLCPSGVQYRVLFTTEFRDFGSVSQEVITGGYDDGATWHTDSRVLTVPNGTKGFAVSVSYTNSASITPSAAPLLTIHRYNIVYRIDKLESASGFDANVAASFKGKKISILGDSISTFAGENASSAGDNHTISDGTYTYTGNHCRYPNSVLSNVTDTYWKKLIDNLGMVLGINESWAGSRVSWDGTEGSDYGADIYIASPTRIGHLDDNGTPDYILVNVGTNDIGLGVTIGTFNTENPVTYTAEQIAALPVATFADAYRAMLIRLQKSYPLAKIVVMLPNYTTSYYNPTTADSYLEIIKEACDYFGVPWVDMRTSGITMYNTGTYTYDGIHPNISGMALLESKVEKFFRCSL